MRKRTVAFLGIVMALVFLVSCNNLKNVNADTQEILIPASYFEFAGSTVDDAAKSYKELGTQYCSDAVAGEKGLTISLTDEQKKNLIKRNDDYADSLINDFKQSNELYRFEKSDDNKKLTFWFDENISTSLQIKTVFGVISTYSLNNIIETQNYDWSMYFEIRNCHTDGLVAGGNCPTDTISYNANDWGRSYNE